MCIRDSARGEMNESYDMEEADLILLTEVIVEELREQAEKKKIQIAVSSDRDVKMMGNHTLLLRMMMNLVQNAISYGKEHGHIDIPVSYTHLSVAQNPIKHLQSKKEC